MSVDPLHKKYVPYSPYSFGLDNPIYFIDAAGNRIIGTDGKKIEVSEKNGRLVFSDNADIAAKLAISAMYKTVDGKVLIQKLQAKQENFTFKDFDSQTKALLKNHITESGFVISGKLYKAEENAYNAAAKAEIVVNNPNQKPEDVLEAHNQLKEASDDFHSAEKNEYSWDPSKEVSVKGSNFNSTYIFIDFISSYVGKQKNVLKLSDIKFSSNDIDNMLVLS